MQMISMTDFFVDIEGEEFCLATMIQKFRVAFESLDFEPVARHIAP
jgi:hypothetical protein